MGEETNPEETEDTITITGTPNIDKKENTKKEKNLKDLLDKTTIEDNTNNNKIPNKTDLLLLNNPETKPLKEETTKTENPTTNKEETTNTTKEETEETTTTPDNKEEKEDPTKEEDLPTKDKEETSKKDLKNNNK